MKIYFDIIMFYPDNMMLNNIYSGIQTPVSDLLLNNLQLVKGIQRQDDGLIKVMEQFCH